MFIKSTFELVGLLCIYRCQYNGYSSRVKGKTYLVPPTDGLLAFAQPSNGIVERISGGEDEFIGFSAPVPTCSTR